MSFKRLEADDFVISSEAITAPLWTTNQPALIEFYTSSVQEAGSSGNYYLSIYQTGSGLVGAEVQFDITYGNINGSGSSLYDPTINGKSPTRSIYGQYRNLVLGDENAAFIFGNVTSSDFYAISIDRSRYKEKLYPGSLTLKLSGSGGVLSLTDDSQVNNVITYKDSGRVFNLVSGSAGTVYTTDQANGWTQASGSYGWFLPDIGTILLNPLALTGSMAANGGIEMPTSRSSNSDGENFKRLYWALSGSTASSITLNSEETITSNFIAINPKFSEFNYSENPSFISGSTGEVLYNDFINNPQTYITTIGLHNDNNELLAVAKLSRPLRKDFTKSTLVRVKLDF